MKTIASMLIIQLILVMLTVLIVFTNQVFPELALAYIKLNNILITVLMVLQILGWLSMVIYLLNLPKRK